MIEACHHVAVVVRDADQARAFYGEVLGLEELERPPEIAAAIPGAWYRLGGSELHVFEQRDFEPPKGPIGPHVAFRCGDFDATVEKLRASGCEFRFGPDRDSTGVARVILRDPTGNTVEITDAALHEA